MNTLQIESNPYTYTELNHRSRKRIGYHVFLSQFFRDLKKKSMEEKEVLMIQHGITLSNADDDTMSVDSTDTPPAYLHVHSMQLAGRWWRSLTEDEKNSWRRRASSLNELPLQDGTFTTLPPSIHTGSLSTNVLQSLTTDWKYIYSQFRNAIIRNKSKDGDTQRIYTFGNEVIMMHSQIYKTFHLNSLLQQLILGHRPLFDKLNRFEHVHCTSKQVIVHLSSLRRLRTLLTYNGLDASTHFRSGSDSNDMRYVICAKICVKDCMNRDRIGCVLDEDDDVLMYKFEK
jgi:hypothetical protein